MLSHVASRHTEGSALLQGTLEDRVHQPAGDLFPAFTLTLKHAVFEQRAPLSGYLSPCSPSAANSWLRVYRLEVEMGWDSVVAMLTLRLRGSG